MYVKPLQVLFTFHSYMCVCVCVCIILTVEHYAVSGIWGISAAAAAAEMKHICT